MHAENILSIPSIASEHLTNIDHVTFLAEHIRKENLG